MNEINTEIPRLSKIIEEIQETNSLIIKRYQWIIEQIESKKEPTKYILVVFFNKFRSYSIPVASIKDAKTHLSKFLKSNLKDNLAHKDMYGRYGYGYLYPYDNQRFTPKACFQMCDKGVGVYK